MIYSVSSLFDLTHTLIADYIGAEDFPHIILDKIEDIISSIEAELIRRGFDKLDGGVFVHSSATVEKYSVIKGPCIIDEGAEIRTGAYIRGRAVIGKRAVVGNSSEIKNSVLFDGAAVPHYNYIGDSILGYKAHFGAGAIASNLKSNRSEVIVKTSPPTPTGRRKVGAFVGDFAEIGCGCVLCPGTVVGRSSVIYPMSCVRGVVEENVIYKSADNIVEKK